MPLSAAADQTAVRRMRIKTFLTGGKMRYPNLEQCLNAYRGVKAEVARDCNVSETQIGRIAKGESLPSLPLIKSIAKSLGKSIDFLLSIEIEN